MRFLVDECTGPKVASWLDAQSHEVFSVFDEARGMADEDILAKAYSEQWILLTNDKDFGEKVFREGHRHHGIVLLRLQDERASSKVRALEELLENYADQLADRFVVGGKLVEQQEASWKLTNESTGITVVAYLHDTGLTKQYPASEVLGATAMGPLKSVDVVQKSVVVDDADMVVMSGSPEVFEQMQKQFGQ